MRSVKGGSWNETSWMADGLSLETVKSLVVLSYSLSIRGLFGVRENDVRIIVCCCCCELDEAGQIAEKKNCKHSHRSPPLLAMLLELLMILGLLATATSFNPNHGCSSSSSAHVFKQSCSFPDPASSALPRVGTLQALHRHHVARGAPLSSALHCSGGAQVPSPKRKVNPLLSTMLSSAAVSLLGSLCSQMLTSFSLKHSVTFTLIGGLYFGPVLFYWYGLINKLGDLIDVKRPMPKFAKVRRERGGGRRTRENKW